MKNMRTVLLMLFATISLSLSAQSVTLSGNVKDKTGEPVIGASVVEKGTTNGTITDFDGNFSLKVSGKHVLVISYIGMKTKEIEVKGKSKLEVTLEDDAQALDEVVVIGYGTVAKKDLTGSVASVSAKQLESVPVSSASEALQGKMAGVQITTTEGSPDADIKIAALSDEVEKVAIPVRKGDDTKTLLAAINDALAKLDESGELTALSEKYFGTDISKLEN